MPKHIDMTNRQYGQLTAIRRTGATQSSRNATWLFRCECGNECEKDGYSVRSGKVLSCDACGKERIRAASIKHGATDSAEYRIWTGMLTRCYNKSSRAYKDYGGRGIQVCDQWRASFAQFFSDMGRRPSPKHSIDRKDNNGNYEPGNCRWATAHEQAQNKRNSIQVEINGCQASLADCAKVSGYTRAAIYQRHKRGITGEALLKTSVTTITHNGITDSISGWSKRTGIKPTTIGQRLRKYGWSPERALTQGASS